MSVPSASRLASAPSSAERSSGPQVMPISRALQLLVSAGGEQAGGRLHRLRQNFDRALGQAGDGFARGQLGVEMGDGRAAFRLGKQDGVGLPGTTASRSASVMPVSRPLMRTSRRGRSFCRACALRKSKRRLARLRPCARAQSNPRDRGSRRRRRSPIALSSLAPPSAGTNRKERITSLLPVHFGRMTMKALRWHSATSVPSCLNAL